MKKKYIFPIILFISMLLGSLVGVVYPEFANIIKPLGTLFLNMMFTLVVPLVFFTIVSSIVNMKSIKKLSKILRITFIVFFITSLISAIVMLIFTYIYNPAKEISIEFVSSSTDKINFLEQLVSALSVGDFKDLFSKSNMLALIIFSIIFGIALKLTIKDNKVEDIFNIISKAMLKFVSIVMYYAPIGIFAYFSSLVAEFGKELIGSYAKTMLLYYVVSLIYFLIFNALYSFIAKGKKGIKTYFKGIIPSFLTSLATQSSLASLPTNMEVSKKMNINEEVSSVSLPIGATMHMEGSSMGSILKIVFLFSIFGYSFNHFNNIVIALFISVLSGVVMSGIPGGGLIGEMLIVSLYGFPSEAFVIIATIGWLIDPPATMLNVTGDISSSMLIEKYVKEKV